MIVVLYHGTSIESGESIMNNGFSIGIHQNLGNNEIKYIYNIFKKFLKRESLL